MMGAGGGVVGGAGSKSIVYSQGGQPGRTVQQVSPYIRIRFGMSFAVTHLSLARWATWKMNLHDLVCICSIF